jgi:hypothetical protein
VRAHKENVDIIKKYVIQRESLKRVKNGNVDLENQRLISETRTYPNVFQGGRRRNQKALSPCGSSLLTFGWSVWNRTQLRHPKSWDIFDGSGSFLLPGSIIGRR